MAISCACACQHFTSVIVMLLAYSIPCQGSVLLRHECMHLLSCRSSPSSNPQFDRAGFYFRALPWLVVPYPVPFRLLGDERKGWIDITCAAPSLPSSIPGCNAHMQLVHLHSACATSIQASAPGLSRGATLGVAQCACCLTS